MRRPLLHLLLMFVLIFQGVAASAPVMPVDFAKQTHCAGHDMQQDHCPCCPDGMIGAGCTAQCSVANVSVPVILPVQVPATSAVTVFADRVFQNPHYVPLIPPPIG